MTAKLKLPVGIDDFIKARTDGFYYVDKTGLITDLLNNWSEVTLFTRPRRFGKTLNMSMLEAFLSPVSDKSIFDGLKVTGERELCENYMGKYPVISITLKGLEGGSYETTYKQMIRLINSTARKIYIQVRESTRLLPMDMETLTLLMKRDMDEADLFGSLHALSEILETHYGQKAVILIDEYDVPLAKAYEDGYYDRMVRLIRNMLHKALKTNGSLKFAVLTGCMRISKESIFTGLNNLKIRSISDNEYDEYFGFTDGEVRQMLNYYGFSDAYETTKDWYDGYCFGQASVYCPWDVISFCDKLRTCRDCEPENYWLNSSGNYAVKKFISMSGDTPLKGEIETLINGGSIEKTIREDLTYQDMYSSTDNIWSVLYTTGYLTQKGHSGSRIQLVIPNREICNIFSEQILELFKKNVKNDGKTVTALCNALKECDAKAAEEILSAYLRQTISIRDAAVRKSLRENFYHGLLLGILSCSATWSVTSNQESGNGYSDIQIWDEQSNLGMVIEVKYADDGDLEKTCLRGLKQIEEKRYADKLRSESFAAVLTYGIAFYLKDCRVLPGQGSVT